MNFPGPLQVRYFVPDRFIIRGVAQQVANDAVVTGFIVQRRQPLLTIHDVAVGAGEAVAGGSSQMIHGCFSDACGICPAHLERAVAIVFIGMTAHASGDGFNRVASKIATAYSVYDPRQPVRFRFSVHSLSRRP